MRTGRDGVTSNCAKGTVSSVVNGHTLTHRRTLANHRYRLTDPPTYTPKVPRRKTSNSSASPQEHINASTETVSMASMCPALVSFRNYIQWTLSPTHPFLFIYTKILSLRSRPVLWEAACCQSKLPRHRIACALFWVTGTHSKWTNVSS